MRNLSTSLLATCLLAAAGWPAAPEEPLPAALAVATPISLEVAGRPLPEVLRSLSRQAKLSVSAGKGLADQKVTALFRAMPLAEASRALAAAVDGTWQERRAESSEVRYLLEPSKRRLQRLERFRRAWKAAEQERDRLTLEALRAVLTRPRPQARPDQPDPPSYRLQSYPEPLFPLVRSLGEPVLARVIREASESFPQVNGLGADKSPGLVVPGSTLGPAQREALARFLDQLADERERQSTRTPASASLAERNRLMARRPEAVQLRLWTIRSLSPRGRLELDVFFQLTAPGTGWGLDGTLVSTEGAPLAEPLEELRHLAPGDAAFRHALEDASKVDLTHGPARVDRGLMAIARATGVNLAADHYTKPGRLVLMKRQRTLKELLEDPEKQGKLAHFWIGSTLIVRASNWPFAYDREPPAGVADRWDDEVRRQGLISLDAYVEAARQMDDARIGTFFNHADERGNAIHAEPVRRLAWHRHVLRGYDVLTERQRRHARRPEGLPLATLSAAQKQTWRRALAPYELVIARADLRRVSLRIMPPASPAQPIPLILVQGLPDVPPFELPVQMVQ